VSDVDRSDHTGGSGGSDGSNGGGGGGVSGVSSPTGVVAAASPADVRVASPPLDASAAPPPIAVIAAVSPVDGLAPSRSAPITSRRPPTTCTCSRGCVRLINIIDDEGPFCSSCVEDPTEGPCHCDQVIDHSEPCCQPPDTDAAPSPTTPASQWVDCDPEPVIEPLGPRKSPTLPMTVSGADGPASRPPHSTRHLVESRSPPAVATEDVRSQPPLPLLVAAPGAATKTKRAFLAARPECPAREPVRILAFEKVQPTYPAPN
jgi:hypothetical protein